MKRATSRPHVIRAIRAGAAVLVLATTAVTLTACLDATPKHTPHPTASSASPTPTPTPTQTATATPTPTPAGAIPPGTPVTTKCAVILTAQQVYDYNPNVVAKTPYTPAAGSLAAHAAAASGRVCEWVNETSGSKLDISVAEPAPVDLTQVDYAAGAHGTHANVSGVTGYFAVSAGIGQYQLFTGAYWIVISSADFETASDATSIAQDVLGNLKLG